MLQLEGYVHRSGLHCGSAALRNLAASYDWTFDEAAAFGFGSGLGARYDARPDGSWKVFRGGAPWLERAFFEHFEVPHSVREGDGWESAWDDVTGHVDRGDPVLLSLDPADLAYLEEDHVPPHTVLAVGYDDDAVLLSDGVREEPTRLPLDDLRRAWDVDRFVTMRHRYLVVTRPRLVADRRTAATRAVRETARFMVEPLNASRATGAPGEEGIPALRAFAEDLSRWSDRDDPTGPVRDAVRSIEGHGEGAALRSLYGEAIAELASWAHAGGDKGERVRDVAEQWRRVRSTLTESLRTDDDAVRTAKLEAASNLLTDVADREEAIFEEIVERV
ncbi:MAG: BtrH N-terminal domain-containing protein [Haloferacaceae archaeon]